MQFEWDGKVGPAAVLTVLGLAVNLVVFVWVGSAFVTKVTTTVDYQTEKIKEYKDDSDKKFQSVGSAIKETKETQAKAEGAITGVQTAISYISEQIKRVEQRLDGTTPAAPAIQPPKQ